MQFDESHPRLKGFNAYYEKTIRPGLKSMEARRIQAVRMGMIIFMPFLAAAGVLAYIGLFVPTQSEDNPFLGLAGACVAGGWFLAFWKARSVKSGFDGHLAGTISKFLGLNHRHKTAYSPIERFRGLSLLPSHDRSSVEDEISGDVEGVPIRLVEAHLEERRTSGSGKNRRTRYVTVFRGLLVEVDFHKKFNGRTVISKEQGWFDLFKSWGMPGEHVKLESPQFENLFDVYSSDQVEARYLLTPAFMERVVALSRHFGRGMQLAFDGGNLYLAGPRSGDMFESGSIFSNLTDPKLIQETLDEFGIIFDIIDTLQLTVKPKHDEGGGAVTGKVDCNAVALVTLRADGKILLVKRAKGFLKDQWSQVTGRLEADETLWQAALRELREETGLVPTALYTADFCDHFYNPAEDRIEVIPVFVALVPGDATVTLNQEHAEQCWQPLERAMEMVPFNGHRQALQLVQRDFLEGEPAAWRRVWPKNGAGQ